MPEKDYQQKQIEGFQRYEALCRQCGACCGLADGDPCANLLRGSGGRYFCRVYENRLGPQVTVSGKAFNCVPIRSLLKFDLPYSDCPYLRVSSGYPGSC